MRATWVHRGYISPIYEVGTFLGVPTIRVIVSEVYIGAPIEGNCHTYIYIYTHKVMMGLGFAANPRRTS